jgi:tRNA pseudouridine55 synthase
MKNGLLLVDKPQGATSHDIVARSRRHLARKDIGHAGTLDPMATGLLVLLVGQATKLSDYILNGDKAYELSFQLGVTTDTDDITGQTLSSRPVDFAADRVKQQVEGLSGILDLPVPIYSAIKVKGKKLYEKARKGEEFTPPQRSMRFEGVEYLGVGNAAHEFRARFRCSKGAYVRAWVRHLGEQLGCGATLSQLRRTHSNPYGLEQATAWTDLELLPSEQVYSQASFVPMNQTLPSWPQIKIEGLDEKLVSNGQIPRKLERYLELEYGERQNLQGIKLLSRRSNDLVALLEFQPPLSFKIRRVFPIKH